MLPPLGEADGGQGVPGVGFIPEFPAVVLPGLVEVEGELVVPEVEPVDPLAEPGRVLQGEPLPDVPVLFELFGFAEGCVVLPGAGVAGEVDPGVVVVFGVPLGAVDPGVVVFGVPLGVVFGDVVPGVVWVVGGVAVLAGGVAVPAGGVAVPVGGVAVPAGGVAVPGVEVCPAVPELPAGAVPPAGELCATTQTAQHRTTGSKISFFIDMIYLKFGACLLNSSWHFQGRHARFDYVGFAGAQLSGVFPNSTWEYIVLRKH